MNLMKRLLSLLTVLVVVSLLAACGGAPPPAPTQPPPKEEPAAPTTEAEKEEAASTAEKEEPTAPTTEAEKEEAASTAETPAELEVVEACDDPLGCVTVAPDAPIRLAAALTLAGPNATLGQDTIRGVEIAIKDRGPVAGHAIELAPEDEGCSAEGGQLAATKLAADESIAAVLGHTCSSSCTPAAPIYNDAGLTMISSSCTAPALTSEAEHVPSFLRTAHNDKVQGRVMAEFVYNELGLRKAATIHDGSPYAEQLQQVFADVFVELGGEITAQEAINVNEPDMQPVLTSIATTGPEFLYYPIFIQEGAWITTQAKEIPGLENVVLGGSDGIYSPDFLAAAGEAAEGIYVSGPDLQFVGERYEKLVADHLELYGEPPLSVYHANAYDAANMILDAIEASAKLDPEGNLLIGRQALRDALYSTTDFDGITGMLTCNELGDCADPKIAINQITNGEYTPITTSSAAAEEAEMTATEEMTSTEEMTATEEGATDDEAVEGEEMDSTETMTDTETMTSTEEITPNRPHAGPPEEK
jgi:branched-chain amino acid transport system substrate-binding protein